MPFLRMRMNLKFRLAYPGPDLERFIRHYFSPQKICIQLRPLNRPGRDRQMDIAQLVLAEVLHLFHKGLQTEIYAPKTTARIFGMER